MREGQFHGVGVLRKSRLYSLLPGTPSLLSQPVNGKLEITFL